MKALALFLCAFLTFAGAQAESDFDVQGDLLSAAELEDVLGGILIRDDPSESPNYARGYENSRTQVKSREERDIRESADDASPNPLTAVQRTLAVLGGNVLSSVDSLSTADNGAAIITGSIKNGSALWKDLLRYDIPSIRDNNQKGKALENEITQAYLKAGFAVDQGQRIETPLGVRYPDLMITDRSGNSFFIEVKLNDSDYLPSQRAKDAWIAIYGGIREKTIQNPTPTIIVRGRNRRERE